MPITYYDRKTEVQFGDRVETKVWFRKRFGRVAYLPGAASPNPDFEHDGLCWVGIRLDDGSVVATLVDPVGNFLVKQKVRFVGRDNSPCDAIGTEPQEFDGISP